MENIASHYFQQLQTSKNPTAVLVALLVAIFDIIPEGRHYSAVGKLVKLYGRYTVFFSILDLAKIENLDLNSSLYPLLAKICQKRFERSIEQDDYPAYQSLDGFISQMKKLLEEKNK